MPGVSGELETVDVKGKPPCGSCLQRYPAALAVPGLSEASRGNLYSVPLMGTERLTLTLSDLLGGSVWLIQAVWDHKY